MPKDDINYRFTENGIVYDFYDVFVPAEYFRQPALWTWGDNLDGALGTYDNVSRKTPVPTFFGGTNWKYVSCGGYHTAAIKTDGTLWTWGYNGSGGLGVNDNTNRNTPVTTFAGGNNWKYVSSGVTTTVAIKTDGTLWVWGNNSFGRLGINNTINRNTPVTTFAGGTNWKSVSFGWRHCTAIKTDGTLWIWGHNTVGHLGDNTTIDRSTPVTTFAGGTNWKLSAANGDDVNASTAAIKTDGTLWTWGYNNFGQLGDNTSAPGGGKWTPVTTFAGGTNWKSVSCGYRHTLAIKTDGTLWVWGQNNQGQLGINNTINRLTPVTTFAGGTNWKSVSFGGSNPPTTAETNFTTATKTDGTLWVWGSNAYAALGTNNNIDRSTPVTTFLGGTDWKSVSAGVFHTAGIQYLGIQALPGIITPGLVLYLDAGNSSSYPGTGTTWTDLSGQGNNGTLTNGPTYSAGDGGTIGFDGVDDYAPIGTTGFPFGSSAGTISGWAKTNTITGSWMWIVSYGTAVIGQSRFIGIQDSTYWFGGYGDDISASGVPLNTWFNMVGVYDGTNAFMYLNGVLVSGPTAKSWNTTANNAQIGRQTSNIEYWNGNIAQVLMYNRALTASEIQQNFNATRSRFGI